jgi:hypothetical protein
VAAMKKGKSYWSVIEEQFEVVSIYDGPRRFLQAYSKLKPHVGHLLAAHWCQSEVCNGGFHQFFGNSTGVLAPEAMEGFAAIGISEWSALLREAMAFFGSSYPRERAAREKLLPKPVRGKKREEWDPFFRLDEEFYAWLRPNAERWEQAADAYARRAAA